MMVIINALGTWQGGAVMEFHEHVKQKRKRGRSCAAGLMGGKAYGASLFRASPSFSPRFAISISGSAASEGTPLVLGKRPKQ